MGSKARVIESWAIAPHKSRGRSGDTFRRGKYRKTVGSITPIPFFTTEGCRVHREKLLVRIGGFIGKKLTISSFILFSVSSVISVVQKKNR